MPSERVCSAEKKKIREGLAEVYGELMVGAIYDGITPKDYNWGRECIYLGKPPPASCSARGKGRNMVILRGVIYDSVEDAMKFLVMSSIDVGFEDVCSAEKKKIREGLAELYGELAAGAIYEGIDPAKYNWGLECIYLGKRPPGARGRRYDIRRRLAP
jgi:hypothetical protein